MGSATGQTISLWDALTSIPDHRRAAGERYLLANLLLVALVAMLADRRDQLGIVRWGRRPQYQPRPGARPIGLLRTIPGIAHHALEQALSGWVIGEAPISGHVAIDGKRLRGGVMTHAPGMHLLAAFSASQQDVVSQLHVPAEANEITTALELLEILPLKGAITGDAIFTQRAICQTIIDGSWHFHRQGQPARFES